MNNQDRNQHTAGKGNADEKVDQWLRDNGFEFNPFTAWDAATDANLHRYFVQHEALEGLWGPWPSLVFEPRGGGKTALRARMIQNCYVGQGNNRPFPISYTPSFLAYGHVEPGINEQFGQILISAASQLLFSLIHRPHWYLGLPKAEQQVVCGFLNRELPGPLATYLNLLDDTGDSELLKRRLHLLPSIRIEPDVGQVLALRDRLRQTSMPTPAQSTTVRWEIMMTVLQEVFRFKELYLLIDGLDAAPETVENPVALARACAPLWQRTLNWAEQQIFVKAFLPDQAQPALSATQPELAASARIVAIAWSEALLIEMLHRRIDVATHRLFSSLDAKAVPGFGGIESQIVAHAPPLPREVLALTVELLRAHVRRHSKDGRLSQDTLNEAIAVYRSKAPN